VAGRVNSPGGGPKNCCLEFIDRGVYRIGAEWDRLRRWTAMVRE